MRGALRVCLLGLAGGRRVRGVTCLGRRLVVTATLAFLLVLARAKFVLLDLLLVGADVILLLELGHVFSDRDGAFVHLHVGALGRVHELGVHEDAA